MSEKSEKLTEPVDHPLSNRDPNNKKEWVKFEEENEKVKKINIVECWEELFSNLHDSQPEVNVMCFSHHRKSRRVHQQFYLQSRFM